MHKIIIGLEGLSIGRLRSPLSTAVDDGLRDQCHLLEVGSLTGLLTAALRNLPNCHDIEVRDFASHSKPRDDGFWKSYGVKTWESVGGSVHYHWTASTPRSLGREIPSIIFNQVLSAIADSGMECHYLGHVTRHDSNALQYPAFEITTWQADSIKKAMVHLKSVIIAMKATRRSTQACLKFKTLLSYMPNLDSFRLNGSSSLRYDVGISMNPEIECLKELANTVTRLELGKICVDYSTLRSLLDALTASGRIEAMAFFRVGRKSFFQFMNYCFTLR